VILCIHEFVGNVCSTTQNTGVGNTDTPYKIGHYIDMTDVVSTDNNIDAIVSSQNLPTEYRPYHVRSGNFMIWYDFTVIHLSHLFESLSKFGILHRFDVSIRLWVNTGTVNVTVANPNSNTNNFVYSLTTVNNTFSNTCPLMINYLPGTSVADGIPDTVNGIVTGLYITRPPTTSFNNVNLSLSPTTYPLINFRLYYSQIEVKPDLSKKYNLENTEKEIVYRGITSSQYNNIPSNSTFNQLINTGVSPPTGVLIVPFLALKQFKVSVTVNGNHLLTVVQVQHVQYL
jgi:hypothetical protein